MGGRATAEVTAAEFTALFESVRTWGRWGAQDQRGAINRLDAKSTMIAARLVRLGAPVSAQHEQRAVAGARHANRDAPVVGRFEAQAGRGAELGRVELLEERAVEE